MATLGTRIRDLRTRRGITQTQLAEGLVTPSMISQIESGKSHPSRQLIAELAERLGVLPDELSIPVAREEQLTAFEQVTAASLLVGDIDTAERLLAKAYSPDAARPELHRLHGMIQTERGNEPEAVRAFTRALVRARDQRQWEKIPDLYMRMGIAYAKASDNETALHLYGIASRARLMFPDDNGAFEVELALHAQKAWKETGQANETQTSAAQAFALQTVGPVALAQARQSAGEAAVQVLADQTDEARRLARRVRQTGEMERVLALGFEVSMLQVNQLLDEGKFEAAQTLLTEDLSYSHATLSKPNRIRLALAEIRLQMGQGIERRRTLQSQLDILTALSDAFDRALLGDFYRVTQEAMKLGWIREAKTWLALIRDAAEAAGYLDLLGDVLLSNGPSVGDMP